MVQFWTPFKIWPRFQMVCQVMRLGYSRQFYMKTYFFFINKKVYTSLKSVLDCWAITMVPTLWISDHSNLIIKKAGFRRSRFWIPTVNQVNFICKIWNPVELLQISLLSRYFVFFAVVKLKKLEEKSAESCSVVGKNLHRGRPRTEVVAARVWPR